MENAIEEIKKKHPEIYNLFQSDSIEDVILAWRILAETKIFNYLEVKDEIGLAQVHEDRNNPKYTYLILNGKLIIIGNLRTKLAKKTIEELLSRKSDPIREII